MFNDQEFLLLMELRAIPQRNGHFRILEGDEAALAETLVSRGLVVKDGDPEATATLAAGEQAYRLNKAGRQAVFDEWTRRGKPNHHDVVLEVDFPKAAK
mgnify:CR=1 FL=1|jgi:hypothetical protein